jgi:DnaK suppressor protein
MDESRARELLQAERGRVEALLRETTGAGQEDRASANEQPGDAADPATGLTNELGDDAIAAQLRIRLGAIGRAERRLQDGTYGLSIRSGAPIPDDRLEADPAAELTADEARGV